VSTPEQRLKWKAQKRAQRRKHPELDAAKRREKYLLNREYVLERQRDYYYRVFKLRRAGVAP